MPEEGIPWRVRFAARLWWPISKDRWRAVWVRYWESEGVSEEQQMEWADEALAAEDD
jgi:hypothetical protein